MNPEEIEKANAANEERLKARQLELDQERKEYDLKKAQMEASDADIEMHHGVSDSRIMYVLGGVFIVALGVMAVIILN